MKNKLDHLVHDVRGCLNTISMNAELAKLLSQQVGPSEKVEKAMNIILQECEKCNDLVEGYRTSHQNQ